MSVSMIYQLFFQIFIPILPFLLFFIITKKNNPENQIRVPPSPWKLPLIGNLHQVIGDQPHISFQKLSKKFGPIIFLKLGLIPTLVISSADLAKEIFKSQDLIFSGRPNLYSFRKLSFNGSSMSSSPHGEYWRQIRKIVILEILSVKRVQSFRAIRDEEMKIMVNSIVNSVGCVNLSELTMVMSSNTVCKIAFRKTYQLGDGNSSDFRELLREVQNLLGGFCVADFFPWMSWVCKLSGLDATLEKNFGKLDGFYDEVINDHLDPNRVLAENEDIIDVLLRIQKDDSYGISLTKDQIKGVITDIFVAGTDTSSATLTWAMTELIKNPSIMKKAQAEVRKIFKEKDKVEENDISQLIYLNCVIKETMRLHPPAPLLVPRETTESCTVSGFHIPAKTRVFIHATAISTDPNYWNNPNEFIPDRFLDNSIDFRGQNFEFLPFGAGRRICPGINFGMLIIELALANLLYHFDWKLPNGMKSEDIDMEDSIGITMHKKIALCLEATVVSG